ncbi:nodulin homeobox-like isoform X3 [Phoenix dactylifera]|uniref:Nodulin homeobox-like isoform X3 n=1 Tax=Phoenix dactylifera TaxID=42345 RepID=A0A8B8JBA0_PHODC|nr:nodulin homeobox-like isoform X3 [Phoenix dactylifera]
MRHGKEESSSSKDQIFDLIAAVRELNGLASRELNKSLKESDNFTIQFKTVKGSLRQIDMERLASSLPLHLIAVLLSPDRDMHMGHVLRGVRLLHTLSDLAIRHARLEQILLDDVKLSEQILDLVFYILIVLAHRKQDKHIGSSPVLHSALVACSLHLLTGYFFIQCRELVFILNAHPKVDIFMDVVFDAMQEDIRILCNKLSELNNEVLCEKFSLRAAERTAHYISQQCEASLQFLLSLCQQKVIRDRVLKHKELCKNGGILLLACMILKLNVPDCFKESFDIVATVSRLKAKILSILLQLCEAESISYLDEVAGSQKTMHLANSVALEFLDSLKNAFRQEAKQLGDSHDKSSRMGLVLLNALRLADIFSDDSNFRSFFMTNTIPVLAEILATPHDEFLSSWCSVNIPMIEEDANLEYDPFTAAGVALCTLSDGCESAQSTPVFLTETNYACPSSFSGIPSVVYAQQRTSYLVKIIANLHVFVPNICEEEEKDLFLNKFHKYMLMEILQLSRYPSSSGIQKATTICKNLSSLAEYARSLTANLLNDEDVHLLSVFSDQLKKLAEPQIGNNLVQALLVKDEGTSDNKDGYVMQQDTQNNGRTAPSLPRKLDANAQDEAPIFNTNDVDAKGRTPEGSLQELDQLKVTSDPTENFETREHAKESGFQEDEKAESAQGEEKQPRKRKRNIMNERQIFLIEKALLEEPEMQRNAASLQSWADKLSCQGSEITSSQLKNWLNNRKARLARAAREARAPSEGENVYPDKSGGTSVSHFYDSPESAGEEFYVPPTRGSTHQAITRSGSMMTRASSNEDNEMMIPPSDFVHGMQLNRPSARSVSFEPGQFVMLVDVEGKEVGKGKVFQVEGRWHGKNLDDSSLCIVEVTELKTDKWKEVQHPSEAAGRTFEEAAARNGGVMRVAWDVIRIVLLSR